ncbi:ferredoxin [Alcaligenes sp. SDU_A2]|uniref:ferredoxin n=1 Tax=Alcaligenes sp. SDU_A2 TaxID=3136634 RepID=UPI002CF8CB2B|nr:ferredoxin [Alcaligenes sp.]
MYVVLTSKPGEYRTEPGAGVQIVAAYEYVFHGRLKAIFAIARIQEGARVRIVEEMPGGTINDIPTRQMEKFETRERAYQELEGLTRFGTIQAELRECDMALCKSPAVNGEAGARGAAAN